MTNNKLLIALLLSLGACAPEAPADMIFIKGDSFKMGTDTAELEQSRIAAGLETTRALMEEVPGHMVTVDDFYMDIYDVTNVQFAQFTQANPAWAKGNVDPMDKYLEQWTDSAPPEELLQHPVTFITWPSAAAYCQWAGKRLPTEIEYEWAAGDGVTRSEFPWGDQFPSNDLVNWSGNDIETTTPVGSYPANGRGLYDIVGNVWHFTVDPWRGSYEQMLSGEKIESPDNRYVVRGGSFGASAANLRIRYRDSHRALDAREMIGFRCARSS